jgi:hypothetical protein
LTAIAKRTGEDYPEPYLVGRLFSGLERSYFPRAAMQPREQAPSRLALKNPVLATPRGG